VSLLVCNPKKLLRNSISIFMRNSFYIDKKNLKCLFKDKYVQNFNQFNVSFTKIFD